MQAVKSQAHKALCHYISISADVGVQLEDAQVHTKATLAQPIFEEQMLRVISAKFLTHANEVTGDSERVSTQTNSKSQH